MSRRGFIGPALLALGMAPALFVVACGGDNKTDPKTAVNGMGPNGSATAAATAPATQRPVTDATVSHDSTASGVNISEEIRRICGITDSEAYFAFDSSYL